MATITNAQRIVRLALTEARRGVKRGDYAIASFWQWVEHEIRTHTTDRRYKLQVHAASGGQYGPNSCIVSYMGERMHAYRRPDETGWDIEPA